jgi:hypothetical protein
VFLLSDRSGVVTGSVIDWDQNVLGALDLSGSGRLASAGSRRDLREDAHEIVAHDFRDVILIEAS